MIRRQDILERFVERFGYRSYLEIGLAGGATFRELSVPIKIGVDPKWRRWSALDFRVKKTTSDRFFARNRRRFDLFFVDGLHVCDQAWRDITHSLEVLNEGGTIVVHDCSPTSKAQQAVPRTELQWTGDVWRAFLKAAQSSELDAFILDTDCGCGVIRPGGRPAGAPAPPSGLDPLDPQQLSWEEYEAQRQRWLRIYPPEEIAEVIDRLAAGSDG